MSLRTVLSQWLENGLEPEETKALDPDAQREFCADIYSVERDFLIDAIGESISRTPAIGSELIDAFRNGDFLQIGAVLDKALRGYLIGSAWVQTELQEVWDQERAWDSDE